MTRHFDKLDSAPPHTISRIFCQKCGSEYDSENLFASPAPPAIEPEDLPTFPPTLKEIEQATKDLNEAAKEIEDNSHFRPGIDEEA